MAVMRSDYLENQECFECNAPATLWIHFHGPRRWKGVYLCDHCLDDLQRALQGRRPINRTHTESGPRCPECGWDTELAPMMDDRGRPVKMKCMECLRIWDLVYELSPGEAGTPDSQADRTESPAK